MKFRKDLTKFVEKNLYNDLESRDTFEFFYNEFYWRTNISVSCAIISSSLVGIKYTFTLDDGVESSTILGWRKAFALRSVSISMPK